LVQTQYSEADRLHPLSSAGDLSRFTETIGLAAHSWIGWRSIHVSDPDENTVEFVCHDPSTLDTSIRRSAREKRQSRAGMSIRENLRQGQRRLI
jgi:hypothetical protein